MSQTPLVLPATGKTGNHALLAGIALSSFAALLLELALTRLFSVVLFIILLSLPFRLHYSGWAQAASSLTSKKIG